MKNNIVSRFSEYIRLLPSAWVFAHFLEGAESSRRILSSSKIAQAVSEFSRPESLKKKYLELSPRDRLRCALAYLMGDTGLHFEQEPFTDPLILSFLVFGARNQAGVVRVFGFDEFEPALRELFITTILEVSAGDVETPPLPQWPWRVLNDITVLAALGSQKQLKKKKSGGLTRGTSSQIKKLIDSGSQFKTENGDSIAKLGISYCTARRILYETEQEYLFNKAAFESWLSETSQKRVEDLIEFTFDEAGGWRRELFLELIDKSGGKWLKTSVFPPQDRPGAVETLRAFRFAGLIDLKKKGSEAVFTKVHTINPDSVSNLSVVIPADFSAIIPQEIDSLNLFRFTQAGVLSSLDRVYKGKIDKSVLSDTLSSGVEGEIILQWLAKCNAPLNVMETVREWLREFSRLYITERCLLVSNEKKVTSQIESFEPLRSLLEPLSADTVYVIKKGFEGRAREVLSGLGFDYRMPGQDRPPSVPEDTGFYEPPVSLPEFYPLVQPDYAQPEPSVQMRSTKYGRELKKLETSELVHVIDYAILTGQQLVFEYMGSPYIKQNTYIISPLSCQKGIEPMLEGEVSPNRSKKQFYIRKISRIGVLPK